MGARLWTVAGPAAASPTIPQITSVGEGDGEVTLTIAGDDGVVALYGSAIDGGFSRLGTVEVSGGTAAFTVTELANGSAHYFQAVAVSAAGIASAPSATAIAVPHAAVDNVAVSEPTSAEQPLSAAGPGRPLQGTVNIAGVTDEPGQAPGVLMQAGYAPAGSETFVWVDGTYVTDNQGGGDIYAATLLPEATGEYLFKWRASSTGGRDWAESQNSGTLTVQPSADVEPPKTPFRLDDVFRSGSQIAFAWRVSRVPDIHRFEICRSDLTAGEDACATRFTAPGASGGYTDTEVTTGHTYVYTVQVVDTSFNRSEVSKPITLTAELAVVDVTWRVLAPPETPASDQLFIAGDNPEVFGAAYTPGITPITNVGENLWEFTAPVLEGTTLLYKFTRGNWETVEQWGAIAGLANRKLTIVKGADGTMLVDLTATDWGAEGPDDLRAIQAWRDPLVRTTMPVADVTGPVDQISVEFTIAVEASDPAAVLIVADSAGAPVAGTVTQSAANAFVFTPAAPLAPGAYTATAFNVTASTPMIAPFVWAFTVE
jgi:hypothetical protein